MRRGLVQVVFPDDILEKLGTMKRRGFTISGYIRALVERDLRERDKEELALKVNVK